MARHRKPDPNDPLTRLQNLLRSGHVEEAADYYAQLATGPRSLVIDVVGIPICLAAERWEAARVAAERLIAEQAGDGARNHAAHARALLGLGRVDEALAALVRSRDLEPGDPSIYELEAIIQRARGDLPAALHAAEGALALDASRVAAHGLVAELLELLGRSDEAIERLRDAVRKLGRDPSEHRRLLERLAALLEARGELDEATAARQLAEQLRPATP